jgi:hypothetical protein
VKVFVRLSVPPTHSCRKKRWQQINLTLKGEQ